METRLTKDTYERPKKTFTDKLSKEQIKEKLKDYKKVEDISKVPLNSHVRYFVLEKDPSTGEVKKLFRMGGCLKNKDNADKYVVLTNGTMTWSVNTTKAVFFKKMTSQEIHEYYAAKIKELEDIIRTLKKKQ